MKKISKDEELLKLIKTIFAEKIPFNKVLGLELEYLNLETGQLKFMMREELIGNFVLGNLHGGVISATLDVMGGLTAFLGVLRKTKGKSSKEKMERFSRIGTIDLRIDYLRPGRGKYFTATGTVLRTGNRVAVTRMELHNDEDQIIALGTGTYSVG